MTPSLSKREIGKKMNNDEITIYRTAIYIMAKTESWPKAIDFLKNAGLFSDESQIVEFTNDLIETVGTNEGYDALFDKNMIREGVSMDWEDFYTHMAILSKRLDWSLEETNGDEEKAARIFSKDYDCPSELILKWHQNYVYC